MSQELGLKSWGKLRADVVAINLRGEIIVCEVKSGRADFVVDKKFESYLPYCNRMYFMFHDVHLNADWLTSKYPLFRQLGIGVMALSSKTGFARVVVYAKRRSMKKGIKKSIILRIAFRNAQFSKRNTRRQRVYL